MVVFFNNRNRNPAIYDDKSRFYSTTLEDEDEDEEQNNSSTVLKSHKALKFKDVARQQILDAKTSRDVVSSSEDEDEFYKVNDYYTRSVDLTTWLIYYYSTVYF